MNAHLLKTRADPSAPAPASKVLVRLFEVSKRFGANTILDGVDLEIAEGEFFTLLGPSGSGKTTLLRLISGFERPDSGRIEIDGINVANTPPFGRDVNTVFQDYALFPHMTVLENVAYGPLTLKVPKAEALSRAEEALAMVRLGDVAGRKPSQLSGGQRQRVAMARAVVNRPRVLLLDEPLGALDLKLRHEMQAELQRIHRELGITFIYVTHDQEEALTMSDRVAIFNRGRVAQVGSPEDLYSRPASAFVAGFVGLSNILRRGGGAFMVRPERVEIHGEAPRRDGLHVEVGAIVDRVFLGMTTRYAVTLESGETINAVRINDGAALRAPSPRPGERVWVAWDGRDVVPVDN